MAKGADTGSETASQGVIGSGSLIEGGKALLVKYTRTRASSFSDGGPSDPNACRAKIAVRSRFALSLRLRGRIEIARRLAISAVVSGVVTMTGHFSLAIGHRLVKPYSEPCACRMAKGADTGSETASQGVIGSGSLPKPAPGKPYPVSRGALG
jgi:hypothetical protein